MKAFFDSLRQYRDQVDDAGLAADLGQALATLLAGKALNPQTLQELFQILNEEQLNDDIFTTLDPQHIIDFLEEYFIHPEWQTETNNQLILNFVRRRGIKNAVYARAQTAQWFEITLKLIDLENFHLWKLIKQRQAEYGERVWLKTIHGDKVSDITWNEATDRLQIIGTALLQIHSGTPARRVAFYARNSVNMALTDLACLSGGIENVMIPADAVPTQIEYMLNHASIDVVFVGNQRLLDNIRSILPRCQTLKKIIFLDQYSEGEYLSFNSFTEQATASDPGIWQTATDKANIHALASIMYTSGTTGYPKGIVFTQRHMICKRFGRAYALPGIHSNDHFLCYLPLFHTFGRFFELMGSLFWGATYTFVEKPAIEILLRNFIQVRPSVFISIPKKWQQIFEAVAAEVDTEHADKSAIDAVLQRLTGGRLRWGLSAAGYLAPEVFRFFQNHGVQLLSGFGMTEGTGGMLMTPPYQYKDNSLGIPLPGISVDLAEDGELMARGPYVFDAYFKPEEGLEARDKNGWFHTGDIMTRDADGFYTIIDRKKEIYKNIKGQTIAPQKIENYFREFKAVKNVFLVGDHREYNTVLIYPDYTFDNNYLQYLSAGELTTFVSNLIVSVNNFLSPFERIVDFAIIDREFNPDTELTPKGSFKRKVIEENFATEIEELYARKDIALRGRKLTITIPNWFIREKGITASRIKINEDHIAITGESETLAFTYNEATEILQIGQFRYVYADSHLDIGALMAVPSLWLGNQSFVEFFGESVFRQMKTGNTGDLNIELIEVLSSVATPAIDIHHLKDASVREEKDLPLIHQALVLMYSHTDTGKNEAFEFLARCLAQEYNEFKNEVISGLKVLPGDTSLNWSRAVFQLLIQYEDEASFIPTATRFWLNHNDLLNRATMAIISEKSLANNRVRKVLTFIKDYFKTIIATIRPEQVKRLQKLLTFIEVYTSIHPTLYKITREVVTHFAIQDSHPDIARYADEKRTLMRMNFLDWLGPTQRLVVDPEAGTEYRWRDAVTFEDNVEPGDRDMLLRLFMEQPVFKESIFIFSGRTLIQLRDVPPGGIWISQYSDDDLERTFRATLQTRQGESFDLLLHHEKTERDIELQLSLLILAGENENEPTLAKEFGAYYPEYDIWTSDFSTRVNVEKYIFKKIKLQRREELEKLRIQWPHFTWSALSVYLQIWNRTHFRYVLADPRPQNFVIPPDDFRIGERMNKPQFTVFNGNEKELVETFWEYFVNNTTDKYSDLPGELDKRLIVNTVFDIWPDALAIRFLTNLAGQLQAEPSAHLPQNNQQYIIATVANQTYWSYTPRALFFASDRFNRWQELSRATSKEADAAMLAELYQTYRLGSLEPKYPDMRLRFFLQTVFRNATVELKNGILAIIERMHSGGLERSHFHDELTALKRQFKLTEKEAFYHAHLTHPYLRPDESVSFVELEEAGRQKIDIVVRGFDDDGDVFIIRGPINPKEVGKLYHLFLKSHLPVEFNPEHHFLLALNDRGAVLGGLFYYFKTNDTVHLEKIVVKPAFRKKGLSGRLMQELFARMMNVGIKTIATGFYRPEFFYKFGFAIEGRYEGLVKRLEAEPAEQGTLLEK
jgi:long-chain acyl-CoA synthetase